MLYQIVELKSNYVIWACRNNIFPVNLVKLLLISQIYLYFVFNKSNYTTKDYRVRVEK